MKDVPPSVAIVFMICITIISVTIVVCDCLRQKPAAPANVVTLPESESTTGR